MGLSLTKKEVAEVTGLSIRTVERHADELRHPDSGDDGRARFDLAKLPLAAQAAWAATQKVIALPAPAQLALALTAPIGPNLTAAELASATKRLDAIEPLLHPAKYPLLWTQHRQSRVAVVKYLADAHKTKPSTVYRWLKLYKDNGLAALVDKDRADKGRPRALNDAALDFLLAAALPRKGAYGTLSVAEIYRAYKEERTWRAANAATPLGEFELHKYRRYLDGAGRLTPDAQLPAASANTFRNWYNRIPEVVKVLGRDGDEAFHNSQEILSYRDLAAIHPLDYVVMDHRRLDFFCLIQTKNGWTLARPWLTAAIDMRTRKWLSWIIVETPSSDSIAACLKRTFLAHGLPAALYWDNGKDFRCEWFEGPHTRTRQAAPIGNLGSAWNGVLDTLHIRVHHAIVKRARSKIIEPNFGNTANFDRTLPWWCGHRPGSRPERFDDLLARHERWLAGKIVEAPFPTIAQVASLYNDFLHSLNEREHSGEGMQKITPTGRGWLSPNEAWERLIPAVARRAVDPVVLQFCFAKRREITVRNGEVRTTFGGRQFHYRLAESSVKLMSLNGYELQFAYDPLDLGTVALYYMNRFLGLANCIELRRMGEDAFVQDERDRRGARREVKKFIETVHQQVPIPDYQTRANRRREVLPERMEPERAAADSAVPAHIQDAAAAAAEDRGFSFDAAPPTGAALIQQANDDAYRDDDTFKFFKGD